MGNRYKCLIFDLDGTLLNTSKGIINSVKYVEEKMKLKKQTDDQLRVFLGPPPSEIYMKIYGLTMEESKVATKYHREYSLKNAVNEFDKYINMQNTLSELKKQGYYLACATLKRKDIAVKILQNASLDFFFDVINGMDLEESMTKADIISECCEMVGIGKKQCLMIGDSNSDYKGSMDAGVSFLGVTYGYGFEPKREYSFDVVDTPGEIIDYICKQDAYKYKNTFEEVFDVVKARKY